MRRKQLDPNFGKSKVESITMRQAYELLLESGKVKECPTTLTDSAVPTICAVLCGDRELFAQSLYAAMQWVGCGIGDTELRLKWLKETVVGITQDTWFIDACERLIDTVTEYEPCVEDMAVNFFVVNETLICHRPSDGGVKPVKEVTQYINGKGRSIIDAAIGDLGHKLKHDGHWVFKGVTKRWHLYKLPDYINPLT